MSSRTTCDSSSFLESLVAPVGGQLSSSRSESLRQWKGSSESTFEQPDQCWRSVQEKCDLKSIIVQEKVLLIKYVKDHYQFRIQRQRERVKEHNEVLFRENKWIVHKLLSGDTIIREMFRILLNQGYYWDTPRIIRIKYLLLSFVSFQFIEWVSTLIIHYL